MSACSKKKLNNDHKIIIKRKKFIDFLKNHAEKRIKEYDKIQVSYDNKDIVITDVFVNELYDACTGKFKQDSDKIFNALNTTKYVKADYDNIICYLNIRLVNALKDEHYNLQLLNKHFKTCYAFVVSTLINFIIDCLDDADVVDLEEFFY